MRNSVFLLQDFANEVESGVNISDAFKLALEKPYSTQTEMIKNLEGEGFKIIPQSNSYGHLEETNVFEASYVGTPQ